MGWHNGGYYQGNIVQSQGNASKSLERIATQLERANQPHFDWSSVASGAFGLFGVLIGAIITHHFNRALSSEGQRARIAVQRKNIIFSKLFKQLVSLSESLSSLPDDLFYFEVWISVGEYESAPESWKSVFYFGRKHYAKAEFTLWNEMKRDIRHTQVPAPIKEKLDQLESAVLRYVDERKKLTTLVKSVFGSRNLSISYSAGHRGTGRASDEIGHRFFSANATVATVMEGVNADGVDGISTDGLEEEVQKILDSDERKNTRNAFLQMRKELDATRSLLSDKITEVVKKYEYGDVL